MKKLSRKIVWLLLIVFVFTVGSGFSVRRSAALPGVGEQLSGFRVETIERLDTPGGKTAYLTHEATGAAVVYIEDTGASPALTLMARTTDGLRRVTLTADSAAELLRGAKESLGAFFGAETEAVPDAEAAYRAFLAYLFPGSDTAGNGAGPVSAENMLAVVCADADGAEDILSWLDGVFSAADAGEELAPDAAYRRIEKPVKETVSLAGEGTGGVYFGIVCPRAGEWTRVRLVALAAIRACALRCRIRRPYAARRRRARMRPSGFSRPDWRKRTRRCSAMRCSPRCARRPEADFPIRRWRRSPLRSGWRS